MTQFYGVYAVSPAPKLKWVDYPSVQYGYETLRFNGAQLPTYYYGNNLYCGTQLPNYGLYYSLRPRWRIGIEINGRDFFAVDIIDISSQLSGDYPQFRFYFFTALTGLLKLQRSDNWGAFYDVCHRQVSNSTYQFFDGGDTTGAFSVPAQVTGISVANSAINWQASSAKPAPTYTVTLTPASGTVLTATVSQPSLPLTDVNFVSRTQYTVTVTATNMLGTSPVSAGFIFTTASNKAVGGTTTTTATDTIHTFSSTGTFDSSFVVKSTITAQILIVAGGGGGAAPDTSIDAAGGGGGGGGVLYYASQVLEPAYYSIGVGNGGGSGANGEDSFFITSSAYPYTSYVSYIATGGGCGGTGSTSGANGGSGGGRGSSSATGTYGRGTVGQGKDGGAGVYNNTSLKGAAGGGGASVNGGSSNGSRGGYGGSGLAYSISGATKYYGGGGGGGAYSYGINISVATGGTGGGGAGAVYTSNPANNWYDATDGQPNTGGGGGGWVNNTAGSFYDRPKPVAGSGGSGVVIIRYVG